jgi:hypothetical protein
MPGDVGESSASARSEAVQADRDAPAAVHATAPVERGPVAERMLALQRTAGNAAVSQLVARWSPPPLPTEKDVEAAQREAVKQATEASLAAMRAQGAGTEAEVKERALSHAWQVSWAMTSKAQGESAARSAKGAWAWATGDTSYKPAKVQSVLGGAFLRMYLAGTVDPDTVAAAGEEIIASPEFAKLQTDIQTQLATLKVSSDPTAAQGQVHAAAQAYLDRRMKSTGLAFRYELNAVLGGVGDADVAKATVAGKYYVLEITFRDAYDFDNVRGGVYDAYRKKLAKLLADGKYPDFWEVYGRQVLGLGPATGLDSAAIFASFMYAIEKKGWTPGPLAWDVTVPMTGMLP